MSLPVIPDKPQDWNIGVIDNLIRILSIESETFDFKERRSIEKNGGLYKDICAMANTSGGYIVLGVGEDKLDGKLIRFTKEAFREGEEDKVNQSIANNVYEVDPTPSIELVPPIYEKDGKTFYVAVKINTINIHKPYFIKNLMQCYVRIGSSSRRASRTTVLNLYSDYREKKLSVEGLRVSAIFAKESLIAISNDLEDPSDTRIIPKVDLESLKRAVASNAWLLSQKGLLGAHKANDHRGQVQSGHYYLRELDILNQHLDIHNTQHFTTTKQQIRRELCEKKFWCPGRQKVKETILFLDALASCAKEYLDKET